MQDNKFLPPRHKSLPLELRGLTAASSILFERVTLEHLTVEQGILGTSLLLSGKTLIGSELKKLKENLWENLQNLGGQVKESGWVEQVLFEKRRLKGAFLSSFEGFVQAKTVLGAMDPFHLHSLVVEIDRPEISQFEQKKFHSISPTHFRFTLPLKVKKSEIPEMATSRVVMVRDPSFAILDIASSVLIGASLAEP